MPPPQLVDYPPSILATTQASCKHSELGPVIGAAFAKIGSSIEGVEMAGMPRVYYLEWLPDSCTIEAAIPIESSLPTTGDVSVKELPGGTALMDSYFGPYDGLAGAWEALWGSIKEQGLAATGMCWDDYVTDPADEPDQAKWQTDIYIQVDIPKI